MGGFILLISIYFITCIIGLYKNKDEAEENIFLKLIGYFMIGAFVIPIKKIILPIGFIIHLIVYKAEVNRDIKRKSALFGFILIIYITISPTMRQLPYEKSEEIPISSTMIQSLNLKDDLERVKAEFDIKDILKLDWFNVEYLNNGEIRKIRIALCGKKYGENVLYYISYDKDVNENNYLVRRSKYIFSEEYIESAVECDRVFETIHLIQTKKPLREFDDYEISVSNQDEYSYDEKTTTFLIDKDNNIRELTKDDIDVTGIEIIINGISYNGMSVNTYSPTQERVGRVKFIIEN